MGSFNLKFTIGGWSKHALCLLISKRLLNVSDYLGKFPVESELALALYLKIRRSSTIFSRDTRSDNPRSATATPTCVNYFRAAKIPLYTLERKGCDLRAIKIFHGAACHRIP